MVSDNHPIEQPIYPYKDKKEILQVDRLICSEFSLVNEDGSEVISMFEMPEKGHVIAIQDRRDHAASEGNKGHLTLYADGLGVYNSDNRLVIGLKTIENGGVLWARNANGQPTWIVDSNSRKPIAKPRPKNTGK